MFPPAIYLKKLTPFSLLTPQELKHIVDGMESEIFGSGEIIFRKGDAPLKYLYVLKCGKIELIDDEKEAGNGREVLGDGEIFGVASVLSSNPLKLTAIARDDCVCYMIKKENLLNTFNSNQEFSDFFEKIITKRLSSLLTLSKASRNYEHLYAAPVIELISKEPIICSGDTRIVDAAKLMDRKKIGSVVISEDNAAVGIFTQRNLTNIVASGVSLDEGVGKHMSSPVIEIRGDGTVMEACLLMMSNGINHMVIADEGSIKGVISSRDILLEFESFSSLLSLSRRILLSEDEKIQEIMQNILMCVEDIASKLNFPEVSRVASGMYDLITQRIIKNSEKKSGVGVDFSWIQTGTSGRKELIFPKIHSVIVYEGTASDEIRGFISDIETSLKDIGFDSEYMEIISVEELEGFVENLDVNLVNLYDARLLYGTQGMHELLFSVLKDNIEGAISLSAQNCVSAQDDCVSLVNGIRALSLEFGIYDSNNTEERCKLLKKHVPQVTDVLESYRVISDIGMRKKFYYKLGRVDEILLRESKKILADFKKFIGKRYAVKDKV
ncbi:MAG: CBS domain-containing protein [Candidatus Altiarchaeota archaeon]|nr:CBS domain-containing protein [Candidatus Altiarchaeota archaeon]